MPRSRILGTGHHLPPRVVTSFDVLIPHQARASGKVKEGSLALLVAFGSGFVWGSALLRM